MTNSYDTAEYAAKNFPYTFFFRNLDIQYPQLTGVAVVILATSYPYLFFYEEKYHKKYPKFILDIESRNWTANGF